MILRNILKNYLENSSFFIRRTLKTQSILINNSDIEIVYKDIDVAKYNEIYDDNSDDIKKRVADILKFYEYRKYSLGRVPSDITVEQMKDLLTMESEYQMVSYMRFLFLTESRKIRDEMKKKIKIERNKEFFNNREERNLGIFDENNELQYRLWGNCIASRITDKQLTKFRIRNSLSYASRFGQPLIIDVDYDDYMSLSEARMQVRHIVMLLSDNLKSSQPFDIYFANCDFSKKTMKTLKDKFMDQSPFKQLDFDKHFLRDSYLNHFPKERLVYLSPNAKDSLKIIDPNDIYIVGAFLDKSCLNKPISHTKALRDGIRQYRLPLNENVNWNTGSKHLCINQVTKILYDIRFNPNWKEVLLKNIPKRKIKDSEVTMREDEMRKIIYLKRKLNIEKFSLK